MKKLLGNFYDEYKVFFDITGTLLISTTLFMAVPPGSGIAAIALIQAKFFLLASTILFLCYIIWQAFPYFMNPYFKDLSYNALTIKKFATSAFFFLTITFFTINLFIYLIATSRVDVLYLIYLVFCYTILYFWFRLFEPLESSFWVMQLIALFAMVYLLLGIPISAYILHIYFQAYLNLINVAYLSTIISLLFMLAAICSIKFGKKTSP